MIYIKNAKLHAFILNIVHKKSLVRNSVYKFVTIDRAEK